MVFKANFQQAPVHWPREITKAKLSQAKNFFNHIFLLEQWRKEKAILGKLELF